MKKPNIRAPIYGRYVEAYGRLGAPFFSFVLSRGYRSQVMNTFRRSRRIEKVEMVLLGVVHSCFAVLIMFMIGMAFYLAYCVLAYFAGEVLGLF
jgi:hypothetical protein